MMAMRILQATRITNCDDKSSTSAKVWVGHPKVGLPRLERSVLSGTSLPWSNLSKYCGLSCPSGPATRNPPPSPGKKRRAPHENIDFERAGRRYLADRGIRRAGAGRRRRQDLVQQMPGLPRDRRRRQEQGRPGAERARRPQVRHRRGLLPIPTPTKFRHHLGRGFIPRIHQGAEGENSGTKMVFAGIKNENEANDLWAYVSSFDKDGKSK